MTKRVYLAGGISGMTFTMASLWRKDVARTLAAHGIDSVSPLRGVDGKDGEFYNPNGVRWTSMKKIFHRDHHDVKTCDAMLVNFINRGEHASRGTLMEVAWAYAYGKPIICAIDDDNPNWDVFMAEAISFMEATLDDAVRQTILLLK